jgi:hypothetical protein
VAVTSAGFFVDNHVSKEPWTHITLSVTINATVVSTVIAVIMWHEVIVVSQHEEFFAHIRDWRPLKGIRYEAFQNYTDEIAGVVVWSGGSTRKEVRVSGHSSRPRYEVWKMRLLVGNHDACSEQPWFLHTVDRRRKYREACSVQRFNLYLTRQYLTVIVQTAPLPQYTTDRASWRMNGAPCQKTQLYVISFHRPQKV